MARRGALTALQAVLAGVSGGAQGLVQQRELERKRQQEQAAQEERQAMNVASLYERGFMTPEQLAQRQQTQQGKASGTVLQGIMGALTPTAPVTPPPTARDVNALSEALATAGREPAQRLSYAGREFVRAETPQAQEERVRALEAERQAAQRQAEMRAEQGFRATEAQRGREFAAEQGALERAARRKETLGELSTLAVQRASALRDDFRAEPAVKKAEAIADATRLVRAAAGNPTAAGDLSLIFAYMRILDPTSTVRQGEFANAQSAAGVPDQIRNLYNRVLQGTRLNERQRRDFVGRADDIAKQQSESIRAQITRYGNISKRYGVPEDLVVYNPFETLFTGNSQEQAIGGTGGPRDVVGGMPEVSTVTPRGRLNPFGN